MRSRRIEERHAEMLAIWEAWKDISLEELRLALIKLSLHASVVGLHRFYVRHGMARKKSGPCDRVGQTRCPETTT